MHRKSQKSIRAQTGKSFERAETFLGRFRLLEQKLFSFIIFSDSDNDSTEEFIGIENRLR